MASPIPAPGPPGRFSPSGSVASLLPISDHQLGRLRKLNIAAGLLHLGSGIAMVVLGNSFSLPVTVFEMGGPPGTPIADGRLTVPFDVRLAYCTAAFALLSAFFHFLIASPVGFGAYQRELRSGRNRFRWVEYSLSATLMIMLIALITGVINVAALIAIAFANVAMILFGWLMEMVNGPEVLLTSDTAQEPNRKVWWTPFWFGCIAGVGPWLAIVVHLSIAVSGAEATPPGFVYGIIASLFVFFNIFAINQWLQYKQLGPWRNYEFGETVYIVLSFVAKSALAWQIFANVLID